MIELTRASLIGKGLHREVHVHPENPDQCIKVVVNRGVEETRREQAYYRLLQRRQVQWDMLPRFYGNIETNMGSGAIFDLIRDADGQVSHTLESYLADQALSVQYQTQITEALVALKHYLLMQNIVTMTLKPKNIVLQRAADGKVKCVIIDNIGNSDVVPVSSYLRFFGKRKILRKWQKFRLLLNKDYPQSKTIAAIADKI